MHIGVPKEIKTHEYRVGMVPSSVKELTMLGHTVLVEKDAGLGIGINDQQYLAAGAKVVATANEIFATSQLIVKVKEPQLEECANLSADQIIFTFLHLAANIPQLTGLLESKATAIAYETVTSESGGLPLLAPMSEVAGRISVQVGAYHLEKEQSGKGILLGGVPGVSPAKVVIIGGGVVGSNAIRIAIGMGAEVTVIDKSIERLRYLDNQFGWRIKTRFCTQATIKRYLQHADLVIGAVLIPGAIAPKLLTREMISSMQEGSVFVDVAIDQGGCSETSKPTNFNQPTFIENGVIHYCVTNIPGSVPRTSAFALNNATLPYILQIAEQGVKQSCLKNSHLQNGVNICKGKVTHEAVAASVNCKYVPVKKVI